MTDQATLVTNSLLNTTSTIAKSDVNTMETGSLTVDSDVQNTSLLTSSREQALSPSLDSNTSSNINDQTKHKIELYMNALVHSLHCTSDSCTFTKCLQFKRVIKHNKSCKKFVNDRCDFCRQLIAISVYHAKNCSNHVSCPVPFCMTIKQKLETNKSIEFITKYLAVLRYKCKKSQGMQTDRMEHKRKCMEKDDYFVPNDATVGISSAAFSADFEFEANNIEMELLKEKFTERLKEIKDKRTAESERSLASQLRLSKMSREKVFATIWQQTVSKLTRLKMSDMNYARLAALILRKESELHKLADSSGYLYLVVDMFYALENQLVKYKELNVPIEVQTETCDLDQVAPSVSEEMPRKKRLKLE